MFISEEEKEALFNEIDNLYKAIIRLREELGEKKLIGRQVQVATNTHTYENAYPIVNNFKMLMDKLGYEVKTTEAKTELVKTHKKGSKRMLNCETRFPKLI